MTRPRGRDGFLLGCQIFLSNSPLLSSLSTSWVCLDSISLQSFQRNSATGNRASQIRCRVEAIHLPLLARPPFGSAVCDSRCRRNRSPTTIPLPIREHGSASQPEDRPDLHTATRDRSMTHKTGFKSIPSELPMGLEAAVDSSTDRTQSHTKPW